MFKYVKVEKHAVFQDEVFTRFFPFFHPVMKFHPCPFDRDELNPGLNFISEKTYKK